jgi:hypothetical protein
MCAQDDHEWYPGTIDEYDNAARYHIVYDDGEHEWIELPSVDVCFSSEAPQSQTKSGESNFAFMTLSQELSRDVRHAHNVWRFASPAD